MKPVKIVEIFRLTRWGDWLVIVMLTALTAGAFPLIHANARQSDAAVVEVNGKTVQNISLKKEGRFTVNGVLGPAVFEVVNGKVHAMTAPCANKVCINQGWTNSSWKMLVCVPNKVVVRPIAQGGNDSVDAVSW